jgi:choline dehydrogenase
VRAAKEVIISGGTINSPQILMLSGIGDGDELKNHGIPVVCHLPGVGQNLQDHVQLTVTQVCVVIRQFMSKISPPSSTIIVITLIHATYM